MGGKPGYEGRWWVRGEEAESPGMRGKPGYELDSMHLCPTAGGSRGPAAVLQAPVTGRAAPTSGSTVTDVPLPPHRHQL